MNIESYAIVVQPLAEDEGGGYLAIVPDLPGCMGDGETQEAALADARLAIQAWVEAASDLGREIPEPGTAFEKAKTRNQALKDAMIALLDYVDHADSKIDRLETRINHLLSLMQDDSSSRRVGDMLVAAKGVTPQHCH